jgi:hypothetical protein
MDERDGPGAHLKPFAWVPSFRGHVIGTGIGRARHCAAPPSHTQRHSPHPFTHAHTPSLLKHLRRPLFFCTSFPCALATSFDLFPCLPFSIFTINVVGHSLTTLTPSGASRSVTTLIQLRQQSLIQPLRSLPWLAVIHLRSLTRSLDNFQRSSSCFRDRICIVRRSITSQPRKTTGSGSSSSRNHHFNLQQS